MLEKVGPFNAGEPVRANWLQSMLQSLRMLMGISAAPPLKCGWTPSGPVFSLAVEVPQVVRFILKEKKTSVTPADWEVWDAHRIDVNDNEVSQNTLVGTIVGLEVDDIVFAVQPANRTHILQGTNKVDWVQCNPVVTSGTSSGGSGAVMVYQFDSSEGAYFNVGGSEVRFTPQYSVVAADCAVGTMLRIRATGTVQLEADQELYLGTKIGSLNTMSIPMRNLFNLWNAGWNAYYPGFLGTNVLRNFDFCYEVEISMHAEAASYSAKLSYNDTTTTVLRSGWFPGDVVLRNVSNGAPKPSDLSGDYIDFGGWTNGSTNSWVSLATFTIERIPSAA